MRILVLIAAATLFACGRAGTSNADSPPADSSATPVHAIQGSGDSSPLDGQDVVIEGIVTGDFQDNDTDNGNNLGGFYLQGTGDGDASTSDGIFVFDGDDPLIDVAAGNRVRVTGTVAEFFGETQLAASDVEITGSGVIQPTAVNLPLPTRANADGERIADLERYEGMLVTFPQTLTVSQLRNLERFGEILLAQGGRPFAFTNQHAPSTAGYAAHLEGVAARRIHLDDGQRNNNPSFAVSVRNGDRVSEVTGVVRFSRGSGSSGTQAYRLMPTVSPEFITANPRPTAPDVAGNLSVATFNVNNYFSTTDDGNPRCGPTGQDDCRGADSDIELGRQLGKIVTVLERMDADIVALVELENNQSASLSTLIDALNDATGAGTYAFVDAGAIGDDGIKVGLIYKPGTVTTVGTFETLDNTDDIRFDDNRHRPVLAQTFETVAEGDRLTVLALHLKSKGSPCDQDGDPDVGDGQGNCSAARALAAAAIVDWIATDPTGSGDSDFVVIGDFNTYTQEDALARFETAGFVNVADDHIGSDAYSFEFSGQFGALDHALVSPSLAEKVVSAAKWHINADESPIHDYNLEFGRDPGIFDASLPYRASDHDPLILGIDPGP